MNKKRECDKKEVVIIEGVRTPQGSLGGALKSVTAQKLGETVVRSLIQNTGIDPKIVDEVIMGCVGQGSDAPNIARIISLMAGLPKEVTAHTVQRNCASGMEAIAGAYRSIMVDDADVVIAGGTESMSNAPYINRDMRFGKRLKHSQFIDSLWEGLTDPIAGILMGVTAENLAEEFNITREDQDEFSVQSHKKAFKAAREGRFKDEIIPVNVPKKAAGKPVIGESVSQDEGPNIGLTVQQLALYPTIFKKNGTVTPGNACPMSDGAAVVLMMNAAKAEELGYEPLGYVRSYAVAGVEPERMGIGPAHAVPMALKKAGLKLKDIELIELNEAFAAQAMAVGKTLKWDWDKVNVNGGAIALGHPLGTTGARMVIAILKEMKRRNLKLGLATLCIGGGMGMTMVLERK